MIINYVVPQAEKPQHYLETALARGRKRAAAVKRNKERERLFAIRDSLLTSLKKLHDAYPSFDELSEFNKRIFELDMQIGTIKQALAGVSGCLNTIKKLTTEHTRKLKDANEPLPIRNAYIGRISSVVKQAGKHFTAINKARAILRGMPTVDDELFTVAIAGFPNVGKSTLLRKYTTAKPAVEAYAFTTKGLNVGYFEHKYNKIQCIDTPGTLNRKKMNVIEKKADITLKYLADAIVYVFDPTESYALQKQQALYAQLQTLEKPMLIYVSKTDLVPDTPIEGIRTPTELTTALVRLFKEWL